MEEVSFSDGVEVEGIKSGCGLPWHYKNQAAFSTAVSAHALLPVPVQAGKSLVRLWQWVKTVCFWQRLKQLKTEKTFAGQGAY